MSSYRKEIFLKMSPKKTLEKTNNENNIDGINKNNKFLLN